MNDLPPRALITDPMAPVGLRTAVSGYLSGIYAALSCAWLLGQVALM